MSTMKPYACHNRPRPTAGGSAYLAQDGWQIDPEAARPEPYVTRLPVLKEIPHVMSVDCRYDAALTDPRCAGCIHAPVDATFTP